MISREPDGVWLTLKEVIAFGHEEVFACLTTEGGLMRWFAVQAEVDLRQGGLIKFGWDRKFTKTTTVAILDYDPGGRIVWDWHPSYDDVHAPVYWTVTPEVESGSKVILRQGPFEESVDSLMVLAEEAETWRWYLCNLRCVLESKHDMRAVRPL
ncbi:MAG: SRPBCC domain-containing protein [Phycisphaerales bacterium]|nr:SRPBCC domain-containing protein [Phycisphaerales bacterium]